MNLKKFTVVASHKSDLLSQDLVFKGVFRYLNLKKYGISFRIPSMIYKNDTGEIFYSKDNIKKMMSEPLAIDVFLRIIRDLNKNLNDYEDYLCRLNEKNFNVKVFFDKSLKTASQIPIFTLFEKVLHTKLEHLKLADQIKCLKKNEIVVASEKLNIIASDPKFKKSIGLSSTLPVDLRRILKNFQKEYSYLGMKFFKGKPWSINEIFQMLKISYQKSNNRDSNNNISIRTNDLLNIANDLFFLRTRKFELINKGCYIFRKFYLNNFNDFVDFADLLNMRIDEVIKVMNFKYVSLPRRDNFCFEMDEKGLLFFENIKKKNTNHNLKITNKEISGLVANRGVKRGIAKVILDFADFKKIDSGDVLVTQMSTPDFLPVMKKACAFVTDIGGITSHAGIVAREMDKPCIVGTKIATKVFKDGDLVEVDANKGIVKKIK